MLCLPEELLWRLKLLREPICWPMLSPAALPSTHESTSGERTPTVAYALRPRCGQARQRSVLRKVACGYRCIRRECSG